MFKYRVESADSARIVRHRIKASACPTGRATSFRRALCGLLVLALLATAGCGKATQDSGILAAVSRLLLRHGAAVEQGDETPESSATRSELDRRRRERGLIIAVGDVSIVESPEAISNSKAFFSYVDESGGAHMVQGLYNVPEPYQASATNLSNEGPVINRYVPASISKVMRTAYTGSDFNANRLDVTVFSATWCGACKRAKQLLDHEGVSYELRDIDDDPGAREEVLSILGSVRIPLLEISGTYVVGYDRKTITKLIKGG